MDGRGVFGWISNAERREADLFFDELMGHGGPRRRRAEVETTSTGYVHTYVPAAADVNKLMVGGTAFTPPVASFRNWADAGVYHFVTAVYRRRRSTGSREVHRPAGDITSVTLHESVSRSVDPAKVASWDKTPGQGGKSVHFIVHRDGSVTQHADVVDDLSHANDHNEFTVGVEIPNPVHPMAAGLSETDAARKDLCSNLPAGFGYELLCNTTWANRASKTNPRRHYVLPTEVQSESVTKLVAWLSDASVGHGLGITRTWPGLESGRMVFGRTAVRSPGPGIWAHGYHHHKDGYFNVLHAWLQLGGGGRNASNAYALAKQLALAASGKRSSKSVDVTPYAAPAGLPGAGQAAP